MSWVKLDDQFADHPKMAEAGPLAMVLHVKALCYCARYLTDGLVPHRVAMTLVDWNQAGVHTSTGSLDDPKTSHSEVYNSELVEALLSSGAWEDAEGGYQIHDYLEYNPSKEVELARREGLSTKRSEAGKKGAATRWQNPSQTNAKPMANAMASRWQADGKAMAPSPSPFPSEIPLSNFARDTGESPSGGLMTALPLDAELTPQLRATFATIAMSTGSRLDIDAEWKSFKNKAKESLKLSGDWNATWDLWLDRAVKYEKTNRMRSAASGGPVARPDPPKPSYHRPFPSRPERTT